jgi:hypothetical protein
MKKFIKQLFCPIRGTWYLCGGYEYGHRWRYNEGENHIYCRNCGMNYEGKKPEPQSKIDKDCPKCHAPVCMCGVTYDENHGEEDKDWSKGFNELLGDYCAICYTECGDELKMEDNLNKLISQKIQEAYEKGRENKAPMGVSQWRNHGEKYKYWDFFKEETKQEIIKEVIEMINKYHNDFEMNNDFSELNGKFSSELLKLRHKISKLKNK